MPNERILSGNPLVYESLTYAELISLRTEYRDKQRNAPHTQLNSEWYLALTRELAFIQTQLYHTEVINPNRL